MELLDEIYAYVHPLCSSLLCNPSSFYVKGWTTQTPLSVTVKMFNYT